MGVHAKTRVRSISGIFQYAHFCKIYHILRICKRGYRAARIRLVYDILQSLRSLQPFEASESDVPTVSKLQTKITDRVRISLNETISLLAQLKKEFKYKLNLIHFSWKRLRRWARGVSYWRIFVGDMWMSVGSLNTPCCSMAISCEAILQNATNWVLKS